jgi:hypothetical protein
MAYLRILTDHREDRMKFFRAVLFVLMFTTTSGCHYYKSISGKVVDNVSGSPIEGALVVAQWTKKHGLGDTYHTLSLITETLTDRTGKFVISSTPDDPFVEPPEMIIYKEGYIPWRNDMTFPGGHKDKDNEWKNNATYRLDVFTDKYTDGQLSDFIDHGMILGIGRGESQKFSEIARKLSGKSIDEIRDQKLKDKKP